MAIQRIALSEFTGGEGAIFPVTKMKPNYALLMQNCIITSTGAIGKVPGYTRVNPTMVAESLLTGYEFRRSTGVTERLSAGGGKVFTVDPITSELTAIKTGLNTTARISFATMNDLCAMVNGNDTPMKYDGTTVSALGGTPPATAFKVHVHKNRAWMLKRGDKMIASYSALNALEDWITPNNAGYIDFKFVLKQGDELLDIATYIDLLIFFFRNHIAIYSGSNPTGTGDFNLVQLIEGSGVVGTDALQPLGTDLLFASRSGVKTLKQVVTTGNLNRSDASENIDPVLMPLLNSASTFSTAYYTPLNLFFLLVDNLIWVYDVTRKAWARILGADVNGLFNTVDGDVYICGTGYLYKFGVGWSFDGKEVLWRWDLAWLTPSRTKTRAYPKTLEMSLTPGAVTDIDVEVRYDFNPLVAFSKDTFKTDFGASMMDEPVQGIWEDPVNGFFMDAGFYEDTRLPVFGQGKAIGLSFQNKSTVGPIEINEIILEVEIGGN